MGKKTQVDDIRIEIDPCMGTFGSRSWLGDSYIPEKRQLAEEMVKQIKRHVDGARYAVIVEDRSEVCEFCGWPWTEGDSKHNGGCCAKDSELMESSADPLHRLG